jgi:UDP-perosamine 4-acetyltransferase
LKPIIFIGGGGHAHSVLCAMPKSTIVAGYADVHANEKLAIAYLGSDEEVLKQYAPNEYDVHVTFVYAGDVNMELRKKIIAKYAGYKHATIVSEHALVTPNVQLGEGVCVLERAVVKADEVGKDTVVNTGAIVEHGCTVGENCLVATGAIICGDVKIGNDCLIGAGAIVREGVTICDKVVVGLGAIVTNDINEPGTYVGNPAKRVK